MIGAQRFLISRGLIRNNAFVPRWERPSFVLINGLVILLMSWPILGWVWYSKRATGAVHFGTVLLIVVGVITSALLSFGSQKLKLWNPPDPEQPISYSGKVIRGVTGIGFALYAISIQAGQSSLGEVFGVAMFGLFYGVALGFLVYLQLLWRMPARNVVT